MRELHLLFFYPQSSFFLNYSQLPSKGKKIDYSASIAFFAFDMILRALLAISAVSVGLQHRPKGQWAIPYPLDLYLFTLSVPRARQPLNMTVFRPSAVLAVRFALTTCITIPISGTVLGSGGQGTHKNQHAAASHFRKKVDHLSNLQTFLEMVSSSQNHGNHPIHQPSTQNC